MKLKMYSFLLLFSALSFITIWQSSLFSWGFFGHKQINRMAVLTLPTELAVFYKKHIEYITAHAVDADKRRYAIKEEAPRHYIDLDHYGTKDSIFEIMPKKWKDAVENYSEDTLQAYGIVPWHVNLVLMRLTKAFSDRDYDKILKLSADLGHYVGDSHVPLHTTENYNGQLTGQKGIHGFWESRIPELYASDYDYFVGRARYVENPLEVIWQTVKESHLAIDSVLDFERELTKTFPEDQKYSYETRGANAVRNYSREYTFEYSQMLDGMVERRMRKAIITLGSFWYTAWINAGKPNLNDVDFKETESDTEDIISSDEVIKTRDHEH